MKIKKLLLSFLMISMIQVPVYAEQESIDETEIEEAVIIEETESENILEEMGISSIDELTQSERKELGESYSETTETKKEETIETGLDMDHKIINDEIISVPERDVSINVKVNFDNIDVEDTDIYTIYLYMNGEPNYVNEEEISADYGKILLNRNNNFENQETISVTDQNLILTAYIDDDYVNAYRITIDDEEYAYKSVSSDTQNYNITLHVSKPDHTITDTNLSETLSTIDKKYLNGEYAESRAAEIEEEIKKTDTPDEPEETNKNPYIFIILGSIILVGIIIGGIIVIRKIRSDDDE